MRELQVHAVQLEEVLVLAHERVRRLGEDAHEVLLRELLRGGQDGQATNELGDHAELVQVLGGHGLVEVAHLGGALELGAEARRAATQATLHDILDAREGAGSDEEDAGGVDLQELLVGVLTSTRGRHGGDRALDDLQEGLLHALARHVAGNGSVLRLAADLVDLVDVDNALFGLLDVAVGLLDEAQEDVLHVLTHVTSLGQRGRVHDREGHVEEAGEAARQVCLTRARGAQQEDVGLGAQHVLSVAGLARAHALVVVIHGHRQGALGTVLADHPGVQEFVDFTRLWQRRRRRGGLLRTEFLLDDLVAQLNALVADIRAGATDELTHLLLALPTERALEQFRAISQTSHETSKVLNVLPFGRMCFRTY